MEGERKSREEVTSGDTIVADPEKKAFSYAVGKLDV
jgi:hypothetical protein